MQTPNPEAAPPGATVPFDPRKPWRAYCPHMVATYIVCDKCQEQDRRERQEHRQVEVWERLIAPLEKVETRLGAA